MSMMTRRELALFAISSAALSVVPGRIARAVLPVPVAPNAQLPLTRAAKSSRELLLDRAKVALDEHRAHFALRDRVAIADFSVASRDLRFHIIDLIGGQSQSYLVAHGRGSDPDHTGWLQKFANDPGSLATSDGAYKTGIIYTGVHGAAMRLEGLEPRNNNAEPRAIVIHGADYVSEDHISKWGKCGRSEGCFALARHMLPQVLALLGPGRLLYAGRINPAEPG
jgi:hypothetical protein